MTPLDVNLNETQPGDAMCYEQSQSPLQASPVRSARVLAPNSLASALHHDLLAPQTPMAPATPVPPTPGTAKHSPIVQDSAPPCPQAAAAVHEEQRKQESYDETLRLESPTISPSAQEAVCSAHSAVASLAGPTLSNVGVDPSEPSDPANAADSAVAQQVTAVPAVTTGQKRKHSEVDAEDSSSSSSTGDIEPIYNAVYIIRDGGKRLAKVLGRRKVYGHYQYHVHYYMPHVERPGRDVSVYPTLDHWANEHGVVLSSEQEWIGEGHLDDYEARGIYTMSQRQHMFFDMTPQPYYGWR